MRATDMPVPSYRLARESAGMGGGGVKRLVMIGGGVLALGAVGMTGWWGLSRVSGGSVPLIEADPRPFRVLPTDRGGMQVANQNDLIFDRNARTAQQQQGGARLAPESEAPRLDRLRQQVQPPPAPPAPRHAAPVQPQAAAPVAQQATPPSATPAPAAPQAQQRAATPAVSPTGRVQVQLGAVISEDAARAEYERISRRMPDAFNGRSPAITRVERDGQTLWRIRTGGFADRAAATQFCEQLRGRGITCTVPTS